MRLMRGMFGALALTVGTGAAVYIAAQLTNQSKPGTGGTVQLLVTIPVPGQPLEEFDISWVDSSTGTYYLADRSNAGIDMIDSRNDRFLGRVSGFVGKGTKGHDSGGPNGVFAIPKAHQVWAGDGDSKIRVVDTALQVARIVRTIDTGGVMRVDEMAYDPVDGIIMAANQADKPGFVTFVSSTSYAVLGKLLLPEAAFGIEQSIWDPQTGAFYVAVPVEEGIWTQIRSLLTAGGLQGEIVRIDPKAMEITARLKTHGCIGTGLALGPDKKLLLGCYASGTTQVLNLSTGRTVTIGEVGGSDEVWYNAADNRYYLAAAHNHRGPVLGILDAATDRWVQNVPTAPSSHSVAVDAVNNHIFVPLTPNELGFDNDPARHLSCLEGCVGVYGER